MIECDPRGGMCDSGGGWDDKAMTGGDAAWAELIENLMTMVLLFEQIDIYIYSALSLSLII